MTYFFIFLDDSTRVKLSYLEDDPCSDYINASYIPVWAHAKKHKLSALTDNDTNTASLAYMCRVITTAGSTLPPRGRSRAQKMISGGWCGSTVSTTSSWWPSVWRKDGWGVRLIKMSTWVERLWNWNYELWLQAEKSSRFFSQVSKGR